MKLTVDEQACQKHGMTLEEYLAAIFFSTYRPPEEVLEELLRKEILVRRDGKYYLTQHWAEVMEEIECDSTAPVDEEQRLLNLAKQMREIYPEGRMKDYYTGKPTSYYFRGNVPEVVRKLKSFFKRFGDYPDEEILNATRKYVDSYQGDFQQKGFRLLKYFILKDDIKQGPDGNYVDVLSPLLDFLENKDNDLDEEDYEPAWKRYARN